MIKFFKKYFDKKNFEIWKITEKKFARKQFFPFQRSQEKNHFNFVLFWL